MSSPWCSWPRRCRRGGGGERIIHSPLRGIAFSRPGIKERMTNGIAIVSPKTAIPATIHVIPPAWLPAASSMPTTGAVQVNDVITSVAPIRNTPA